MQVCAGLKDTRDRINSVKNTMKITDAMKLVAAAKVRRAQDAVVNGRPFAENLVKVTPFHESRYWRSTTAISRAMRGRCPVLSKGHCAQPAKAPYLNWTSS